MRQSQAAPASERGSRVLETVKAHGGGVARRVWQAREPAEGGPRTLSPPEKSRANTSSLLALAAWQWQSGAAPAVSGNEKRSATTRIRSARRQSVPRGIRLACKWGGDDQRALGQLKRLLELTSECSRLTYSGTPGVLETRRAAPDAPTP